MAASRRCLPLALLLIAVLALAAPAPAAAASAKPPDAPASDAFADKTKSATRRDGLLVTWLDARRASSARAAAGPRGPRSECGRFLYLEGIRTGLGSNPVGLDRGQVGETRVVAFRRVGARVLLEQPNLRYRARRADSNEVRAVRESFATLGAVGRARSRPRRADGRLLVDLTSFLVRDAHGVVATLKARRARAPSRSTRSAARSIPTTARASPTTSSSRRCSRSPATSPGREVRATAPTPQAITLVQHQSLVRLPDDGYRPRAWDPRSGSFEVLFADYAQPIARRHRRALARAPPAREARPAAARSRVKKPIVYYVDSGAPEPIRSALVEGASWWAKAFEAAGFIDAFQVKLLPPGRRPARRALQRHPVGAPRHARLVVRRRRRSTRAPAR